MDRIFITVLNMSLTASYCIAAVMVLRLFLRRQPKLLSYLLWSVVLFRLLCPFALTSSYSLLRMDTNMISKEFIVERNVKSNEEIQFNVVNDNTNTTDGIETSAHTTLTTDSQNPGAQAWMQKALSIASRIWLVGIVVLAIYSTGTFYRLYRSLRGAIYIEETPYEDAHFRVEGIATPFVFGIIRPRIYLPAQIGTEEKRYVLEHEKIHIARKDYLIKLVAYGAVCIHWFNPLAWIAFALMGNDMEMSCDEAVIKKLGPDIRKEYSLSLLSLASERTMFQGSPLAFGEGEVKGRVRNILTYRKRTLLTIVLAAAVLILIGIGLALNPAKQADTDMKEDEELQESGEILEIEELQESGKLQETGAIQEAEEIQKPEEEQIEPELMDFIEQYATASSSRDGAAIVDLYIDSETALSNAFLLEKDGDIYTMGVSSPMAYSFRYQIFQEENRADIRYYMWTSDLQTSVWKEEIQYVKLGERYKVTESKLKFWDSISSAEEFEEAYLIQGEHHFIDYIESGFVDAITAQRENSNSSMDTTVYETPETAAEYILNLTGGKGVASNYTTQAMVRYTFADGSEVMIPMFIADIYPTGNGMERRFKEEPPIWIVDTAVWNAGAP